MSNQEVLRQLVRQRLDLAAEEIFGLFERTIEEYEKKLTRSKKRNRQHKVQTAVQARRTPGEVPGGWTHGENQQDPELQPIKEEQEEVLASQEGARPPELKEEEEERSRFRVTAVRVKSEDWRDSDGEHGEGPRTSNSAETHVSLDEDESVSDSESDDKDTDDEDTWQTSLPDFGPLAVNGAGSWTVGGAAEPSADGDERSSLIGPDAAPGLVLGCLMDDQSFSGIPAAAAAAASAQRRAVTGDKVFGCEVCGQRFNRRTNLRAHMRVHTGEQPFQCEDCGRRFRHAYNFRRHLRVHSGEKPFGCDVCSKRFGDQRVLSSHMSVHTGDKPFGCDVCGRTFGKRSYLKTHTMVHTGEKPFGCGVCERRFTRKGDLKRHMLVHLRTGRGAEGRASGTGCGPPT